ncbi:ATP-binding protein [Glutamicibacter sp. PS]|uniref:ATP-binding protein n=1 Tax=Glutamicibacter sp. PS TaxID=3075634 RepID=UPI00284B410B|nr:ATP-binding protein [Glutamicibacter sp. PS]MDR4534275.1 ATP-binding protein [Glutamicibacter sp. PS]
MKNPFKPTAGARPPLVIGREEIRQDIAESVENGAGAPGLLAIFSGPRGIGKTVMLGSVEDEAIEHGWIVISETAIPGLVRRIDAAVRAASGEFVDQPSGRRITGITLGPVGVQTQLADVEHRHWRHPLTELLKRLRDHGTGLMITIDEIHAIDRVDLVEVAAVIQHMIREDLPIALMLAGLPKAVDDLLNDEVSTFLRRAEKYDLHKATLSDVAAALRATFDEGSISISELHVRHLAEATGGYPFLIQLVGYHVWSQAVRNGGRVTAESLEAGVEKAKRRMGATVLQSAYNSLSDIDKSYLLAMAVDDGPSKTSVIAERLGVSPVYAGQYRLRLLAAGAIEVVGHGYVDFAMPTFREFLRASPAFDSQAHLLSDQ